MISLKLLAALSFAKLLKLLFGLEATVEFEGVAI